MSVLPTQPEAMSLRKLSDELQKTAEEELKETPSRIQEDLKHIREWLKMQPHLIVTNDDQSLIKFLRACKYSLQRTKEKIDTYYTLRNTLLEFYDNRDPMSPKIQKLLKSNVILPLLGTVGKAGPRIILLQHRNCNPDTISAVDLLSFFFMTIDILTNEDDNSIIGGIVIILDFKGYDLNYIKQMTPTFVQNFTFCVQEAYPIRLKAMHLINVPSAFVKLYEILKHILGKKLQERFFLYNETMTADFYKNIPQSILPVEIGGNCGSVSELIISWNKKFESYQEWFLEDAKYRSNEKLRVGKSKLPVDVFGTEGSFRKINID